MDLELVKTYWDNGNLRTQYWVNKSNNIKGHPSEPSYISFSMDGSVYKEEWKCPYTGNLHREDGPAAICKVDGRTNFYLWYLHGMKHRIDGPAVALFYGSGDVKEELWYLHNRPHRIGGPAAIFYTKFSDRRETHQYWVNGKRVEEVFNSFNSSYPPSKEEWVQLLMYMD